MAAAALTLAAIVLPVQAGSSGREWRYAAGILSERQFLAESLVSYNFWRRIPAGANAIFIGEEDRYHAPFALAFRAEWPPVSRWRDREAWSRGIDALKIGYVIDRGRWPLADAIVKELGSRLVPVRKTETVCSIASDRQSPFRQPAYRPANIVRMQQISRSLAAASKRSWRLFDWRMLNGERSRSRSASSRA